MTPKHSNMLAATGKVTWVLLLPVRAEQNKDTLSEANQTTSEYRSTHKEYLLIHHKPQ